jgi:hypothetical protein
VKDSEENLFYQLNQYNNNYEYENNTYVTKKKNSNFLMSNNLIGSLDFNQYMS